MDYSIWGAFQQLVYRRRRRIRDVITPERSPAKFQSCWEHIAQDVIVRAIGQFCKQLSLVNLLQPVKDTLNTALTNVFDATRTLSCFRVLLQKYRIGQQK